ncbi:MAG: ATP-binding cassette domain-containing protein [Leptothrix sp. (in: Bacteria)]|jgi:tungstate transport system ATP-binding protein|nr:ATP-binding cassette domain-containing protein [Leptothrix sp. (in: b-proteobacteria)]
MNTTAFPTAAPAAELITLRDASVQFGSVKALQPLDLVLHRGDRLALIGANGCGKTTLLRLLHGLQPPSSGERRVHALQGRAPVQAMLFQRPFLLHLSVRLNLRLALWLAGVPGSEHAERMAEALHRVGLETTVQRQARALSGGQQQRLALARAWMLRPDILFLDEPTASLDPGSKREVEALIDEFARAGMTIVMSTHNLGQVKRLASRVIYLEAGRRVVDWPADRFFTDVLPPEAALFLKGELPWH